MQYDILSRVFMQAPRVVIAGLRGGSGKTVVSLGLAAALREKGLSVVPFKKGPDYIDAGWLAAACGRPCYNLDPFLIGPERLLQSFVRHFNGDCAVIEGNRGLFDGMDSEGSMSTAVVSRTLKSPVILVVDCTKMTRTTAAILLGIRQFDRELMLGGVILNRIAGERHETVIRDSIKRYTQIPVLGAIPRLRDLELAERHMGLTPFQEHPDVSRAIEKAKEIIKKHADIDRIWAIARSAPPLIRRKDPTVASSKASKAGPRIGILRDSAFQFYYPENFEELQRRGGRLIEVSALRDRRLPPLDALYIGGGFPETHAIRLAENLTFRKSLKDAIEKGLPVYAECGGLMYLGRAISLDGVKYPMADVFPLEFVLHKKPQAHGYTAVRVTGDNAFFKAGTALRGHEFHYSAAQGPPATGGKGGSLNYCFQVERGRGIFDAKDGLVYKNVLATYTHLHALGSPEWADGVIKAAKKFSRL